MGKVFAFSLAGLLIAAVTALLHWSLRSTSKFS
jgi:hypothetical protein